MKILLHIPNLLHEELELKDANRFETCWLDLIKQRDNLKAFTTSCSFFDQFLLFRNGIRLYDWDWNCREEDIIIVAAANKLSPVSYATQLPDRKYNCTGCSNDAIAYVEVNDSFEASKHYCANCFVEMIEGATLANIAHSELSNDDIVEFALSGERDSVLALHFLKQYRDTANINFSIDCIYNDIGLGLYDDRRRTFVEAMNIHDDNRDKLSINRLHLPLIKAYKNCGSEDEQCPCIYLCRKGQTYRDYASHFEAYTHTAGGSGTIEDNIASYFYSPSPLNLTIQKKNNRGYITILEGISEECLSIYAALNNIDYCLADCTLEASSHVYKVRKYFINPYKALFPNFKQIYNGDPLAESHALFGVSSDRRTAIHHSIGSSMRWFKCKQCNSYHSVGEASVEDLKQGHVLPSPPHTAFDDVELAALDAYEESELRCLQERIPDNNVEQVNYRVSLSSQYVVQSHPCYSLIYDVYTDAWSYLPTTDVEQDIMSRLATNESGERILDIPKEYPADERASILRSIQRLAVVGLVCLENEDSTGESNSEIGILLVDIANVLTHEDMRLIETGLFDGAAAKAKRWTSLKSDELSVNGNMDSYDMIIVLSQTEADFEKLHDLALRSNYSGDLIYVYPYHPITVGTGCYKCLRPKQSCVAPDRGKPLSVSVSTKVRLLSVLKDLIEFDECLSVSGWKGKSILYYINPLTNTKKKELINCSHLDMSRGGKGDG